jgi:flavin-binding protein dodecin
MLGFLTRDRRHTEKNGNGNVANKYEDLLDDGVDVMPVMKIIEVVATSTESFEDAIAKGVGAAAKSLRHVRGADVEHLNVAVKDGGIVQYRADLKIAFAIDPDEDEDDDD